MSADSSGNGPQFAFNGDAKARDGAVDRLRCRVRDGELDLRQTQAWDAQALRGSLMGTTVHSTDPAVYQQETGIPAPLAVLQETLFTLRIEWVLASMDPPRVEAAPGSLDIPPERWLEQMPLDADLRPAASRFLHYLLCWVLTHETAHAVSAAVTTSMRGVAGLHADAASGRSPAPSVWAGIRNAAILATDAATDDTSRTCWVRSRRRRRGRPKSTRRLPQWQWPTSSACSKVSHRMRTSPPGNASSSKRGRSQSRKCWTN